MQRSTLPLQLRAAGRLYIVRQVHASPAMFIATLFSYGKDPACVGVDGIVTCNSSRSIAREIPQ